MNKNVLFLLCMIILISTVSFASAADDMNQTIENSADTGTFSELEEKITTAENQSVISLDKDYLYDEDISKEGININKNITINGNGHTIDANHASRIFDISADSVILNNITFINALTSGYGGAINCYSLGLEINDCTFIANSASDGGAIYCVGKINITNSKFTENTAYFGAAIFAENSNILINNTLFSNNSATRGAAICFWSTAEGYDAVIVNSILNNNTAKQYLDIYGFSGNEYKDGIVYLTSEDSLADHQIGFVVTSDVLYADPLPDLTFINVSYNEFKNQSFIFEEKDLKFGIDNETIRLEVYEDDVLLVNTTNITHDGLARFDYGNLSVGSNCTLIAYYKNLTDSVRFKVKKDSNFTMSVEDIVFGDELVINFNISSEIENYGNAKGSFEIWDADAYGSRYYDVPEYYGDFKFIDDNITIRFYQEGTFIAFLDFKGDDVFYSKRINSTFNVIYNRTGNYSVIEVEPFEKTFGENKKLYFNLTDENGTALADREIQITINGVDYIRTTDSSGQASIAINLGSGSYTADFLFKGDDDYLPTSAYLSFDVLPTVYCEDMEKYVGDPGRFTVTCTDTQHNILTGGVVDFNINGVIYHRNINENGEAGLNINLSPGEYIITAKNPETGELRSAVITVLPKIVNNHDLVKYYRNDSQFTVRLDGNGDLTGQIVTFNINGVFYERKTDENGVAKLNINLSPGEYIITSMYNGCMVSNNITVLPVLTAENMKMSYLDGSTFNATIVDGQGNPLKGVNITFNINGVFYQRTTDDNGTARLNIRLMVGEYIITSAYENAVISNKITISS